MSDRKRLKIEYVPLSILKRWSNNPKDHDLGDLHVSVNEFGFRQPMSVNERNGELEAGHGRLDMLQQKFDANDAPPEYVDVNPDTGEWLVPVQFFDDDDNTHVRYAIADNRIVEKGGWDYPKLVKNLEYLYENATLDGTGYDVDDLDALSKQLENPVEVTEPAGASEDDPKNECPQCGFKW